MAHIQVMTKVCPQCGQTATVTVNEEDWRKYLKGMLMQEALPYLTADIRERFVSGYCPNCWNEIFKDIEDE